MSTYMFLAAAITLGVYALTKLVDLLFAIGKGVRVSFFMLVTTAFYIAVAAVGSVWLLRMAEVIA